MIAVCATEEQSIESPVSRVFGRARNFMFIDTDTLQTEIVPNPAINEGGGAGIKAAEFVVNRGAGSVIAGNFGPNAFQVLNAAGLQCYSVEETSIRSAIESIRNGDVAPLNTPSAKAHAGMQRDDTQGRHLQQQTADLDRESELAALKDELADLRMRLSRTLSRIQELEKEN